MSETWADDFGNVVNGVHDAGRCRGEFCTIHNNSTHPLSLSPQKWSDIYGIMLRQCLHGKFHTDVDEIGGVGYDTPFCKDCDGCCRFEEGEESE
jgi:hypothetical protein